MSITIDTSIPSPSYLNYYSVPSGATGMQFVYSNTLPSSPSVFGKLILTGITGAFIDDLIYNSNSNGFNVAFNFSIPNGNYQYETLILNSGYVVPFPCYGDGMGYLGDWASGVYLFGLGSPSSLTPQTISGWAASQYVIGKINVMLEECHSGCSGIVSPPYNEGELGVLEKMYLSNWYGLLARGAVAGNNVVSLADGDSKVSFVNNATISKNFLDAAKQTNLELNYIANSYRQGQAFPRDVSFYYVLFNNAGATYWGAQGYIG